MDNWLFAAYPGILRDVVIVATVIAVSLWFAGRWLVRAAKRGRDVP